MFCTCGLHLGQMTVKGKSTRWKYKRAKVVGEAPSLIYKRTCKYCKAVVVRRLHGIMFLLLYGANRLPQLFKFLRVHLIFSWLRIGTRALGFRGREKMSFYSLPNFKFTFLCGPSILAFLYKGIQCYYLNT